MADTVRQTLASEHMTAMAEAARWAPSVHNTQPWRFSRLPDGMAVRLDRARVLPVLDPNGRLAVMSCGAAVLNARIALAALRLTPQLEVLPGRDEDVIARYGPAPASCRRRSTCGMRLPSRSGARTGGCTARIRCPRP